jgi:hypothetical protein
MVRYFAANDIPLTDTEAVEWFFGRPPTVAQKIALNDRTKMKYGPDRLDALVWALTEFAIEVSPGDNILGILETEGSAAAIRSPL